MPDASGDPNLAEAERVPLTSAGRLTVAGFPASLGATVALAVLTYRFLEAPFRRQRLRFTARCLSALARKFGDVSGQAARVAGWSSRCVRRSRSARVYFHSNGAAIFS